MLFSPQTMSPASSGFPTDLNRLWDALRKLITILAGLCEEVGIGGWRQSAYQLGCRQPTAVPGERSISSS